MSSRKLGQWRPLSSNDRRLITRLGSALAEFYGAQLSDKHRRQAQRILCDRNGPLADRVTGTQRIDLETLVV